jgi:hypothetical protein
VPLLFQECSGDRTIYAAAHCDDYSRHVFPSSRSNQMNKACMST